MKKTIILIYCMICLSGCSSTKDDSIKNELNNAKEKIANIEKESNDFKEEIKKYKEEVEKYKPSTTVDTSKGVRQTNQNAYDTFTSFLSETNSCINGSIDNMYIYFDDNESVIACSCIIKTDSGIEYPAFIHFIDDNINVVDITISNDLDYEWMDNELQSGWSLKSH